MKKVLVSALAASLAACSGGTPDKPAEPVATATPDAAVAQTTAPAPTIEGGYLVGAGTYQSTMSDGVTSTTVLSKDGTYTDTSNNVVENGTWKNDHGKTCLDPAGDTAPTRCYNVSSPDASGKITIVGDDGSWGTTIKTS